MKKTLSILLVLILALSMAVGCTQEPAAPVEQAEVTEEKTEEKGTDKVEASEIVKVGLGHINSIAKSKDLDGDVTPVGQVDTTIAAVGFDKDGKVVSVSIDTAQTKVAFDAELQLTSDTGAEYKTKKELKEGYGMVKASKISKEWFEQIEALENWMVGKTVAEIKGLKVKKVDDSHTNVPDIPELTSSVTITVEGYIGAVEEAYKNAVDVNGAAVKVGLGHDIAIGKSKSYSNADGKETLPVAQVDTTMSATAFDKDGKVVKTLIDNAQTKINFDKDGKVTSDKTADVRTKMELGKDYGMLKASKIGKEWFEQIAVLEDWMVGKTVSEIKGLKVKKVDDSHTNVPDVAELTSTVTITVEGYIFAVSEAFENAK